MSCGSACVWGRRALKALTRASSVGTVAEKQRDCRLFLGRKEMILAMSREKPESGKRKGQGEEASP